MPQVFDAAETDAVVGAYRTALTAADAVWQTAKRYGRPDAAAAVAAVDALTDSISSNRDALIIQAISDHDEDYTLTHIVNVSILTMAQAQAAGILGALLRDFGIAALTHDIGKVRTPAAILNKPGKLSDDEFAIMQRHAKDGAEILEATPELPSVAAIVAFEHHLRLDGSGYPSVARRSLSLATMLCSIADVYDAMRSGRSYQESHSAERIFDVLTGNGGRRFDQVLVRRFATLLRLDVASDPPAD